MPKTHQGTYAGNGRKVAIVASRFNDFVVSSLVAGAVDCLVRHGANEKDLDVYRVPGALEIPPIASRLAAAEKHHGIICLGAVIRGGTPHFDYVAGESSKGIAEVARRASMPVIFGVLTTDTIEQAIERAGIKSGNRGADAALALLEMMDLFDQLDRRP